MHPSFTPGATGSDRPEGVVGAIPARYASRRLPGKPLRKIAGRPMIEHVYRRAREAAHLDRVVVLTDDERIAEAVEGFGGEWEITPRDCASGTDRIAYAARRWRAAAVVNIQGDEPLIEPQAIERVAQHLLEHPEDPLVTLAAPAEPGDRNNPDVVKVVFDRQGRALYFSRAPIPFLRGSAQPQAWRHIGVYGYQLPALIEFAALAPAPLEEAESLEQLRALENGLSVRVLKVERAWWGVDTMEDLERVERYLASRARQGDRSA
ncbi:MAG: 3-deoxy-manno-octulosonate cytidylyltransferase [Thermoanaerobaculia bacterium]